MEVNFSQSIFKAVKQVNNSELLSLISSIKWNRVSPPQSLPIIFVPAPPVFLMDCDWDFFCAVNTMFFIHISLSDLVHKCQLLILINLFSNSNLLALISIFYIISFHMKYMGYFRELLSDAFSLLRYCHISNTTKSRFLPGKRIA